MNKILKKLSLVLVVTALTTSLVSCNNTNNNKIDDNNTKVDDTLKSEKVNYPITITDSFGNEVTLDKEPERVISVAPNITELIYKLDAGKKLIGRTDYCDTPEDVKNVESIGTLSSPNIEKIISLEPDLVVGSTHFSEEHAAKLKEAGIKVIDLYEESDINGDYKIIDKLGTALNRKEEALTTVDDMKDTIDKVKDAVRGLDEPSVYYVVGFGEGGDFTAPPNTFIGQLIQIAGGRNIVPESKNWSYSKEALLEADPEIIVVGLGQRDAFMNTDGYKDLTAVKNGKIYEINNNLLDRQGYRNAEGVLKLAEIFHPEAFK